MFELSTLLSVCVFSHCTVHMCGVPRIPKKTQARSRRSHVHVGDLNILACKGKPLLAWRIRIDAEHSGWFFLELEGLCGSSQKAHLHLGTKFLAESRTAKELCKERHTHEHCKNWFAYEAEGHVLTLHL